MTTPARTPPRRSISLALSAGFIALGLCLPGAAARAGTCSLPSANLWALTGAFTHPDDFWGVDSHWTTGVYPNNPNVNVCIVDGNSIVTLNVDATVKNLQIASGDALFAYVGRSLTVAGTDINNSGIILLSGSPSQNVALTIKNNVTLSGGGLINMEGFNSGSFIHGAGYTLTNLDNTITGYGASLGDDGMNFINEGILESYPPNLPFVINSGGGSFINAGQVLVTPGTTMDVTGDARGFFQSQLVAAAPSTEVDGLLIARNGMNIQDGVLEGDGTIQGNLVSAGQFLPGLNRYASPSSLAITGNYDQLHAGILAVSYASRDSFAAAPPLIVGGIASLDGTLAVSTGDFLLLPGDALPIMEFSGVSGDFTALDFNGIGCNSAGADLWTCVGGPQLFVDFQEQFLGSGALDLAVTKVGATTVPEPASWTMLLLGVGALGVAMRSRRRTSAISLGSPNGD